MASLLCDGNHAIPIWEQDEAFQRIYAEASKKTVVEHFRCHMLYQLARRCSELGDFAEVGVYRGGTARLIAKCTNRPVHLFDTFAGMPDTDPEKDVHRAGEFADTSLEDVKEFLKDLSNVRYYKGRFPHNVPFARNEYGFVHVDVDVYQSAKDACRYFYPQLVPSGVIIFDDYGFPQCDGVRQAVDESFDKRDVIYLPTGQALVTKCALKDRGLNSDLSSSRSRSNGKRLHIL